MFRNLRTCILTLVVGLGSWPAVGATAARPARQSKSPHACVAAARSTALSLLKLHSDNDPRASVDAKVKVSRGVLAGPSRRPVDVMELTGHVYKADYLIRVSYLRTPGCARVGFELKELSASRQK